MQNSNCSQCSANITASGRTENSSVTVNKNNKLLNLYILSSISTRCNILQYSLFLSMLYMFQAVSPPIIRSSKLYTLHLVYVKHAWHIPRCCVYSLSSWWWAQKPPETCRALTVIKNTVECCILLIYLKEYINDARSHEHQICWAHITKFSATIFMLLTLARLLPSLWFFQYSSCPLEVGTHR